MKLLKHGKTKDVYILEDGNVLLKFKDTVTGGADGAADPGGNKVVGTEDGVGRNALLVSNYYLNILQKQNIATHFVSADLAGGEMVVKSAGMFGRGLEFVLRYKAMGSFTRRFGSLVEDGFVFKTPVVEVTLKDDDRDDPPVTEEILLALNVLDKKTYNRLIEQTRLICEIVRSDLSKKGLELIDIKLEFGLCKDGKVMLVDEISAGNMRVFQNGKKLDYATLSKLILA